MLRLPSIVLHFLSVLVMPWSFGVLSEDELDFPHFTDDIGEVCPTRSPTFSGSRSPGDETSTCMHYVGKNIINIC